MKRAIQSMCAVLLGIGLVASVALLADRFAHHGLFAPIVWGAIVILLGVYVGLYRRAQRQTNSGRGG